MVQRNTHSRLIALLIKSLTLRLVIISFVAAWLARDTALASSVQVLQAMTNRVKDNRHPWMWLSGIHSRLYGLLSPTA